MTDELRTLVPGYPVTCPWEFILSLVRRIRIFLLIGFAVIASFGSTAFAKLRFESHEIEGRAPLVLYGDLDGDQLKDVVLVDGVTLSIFYQDPQRGFARESRRQYCLSNQPAILWPSKLGTKAESLLLMTSEGVTELRFDQRTETPVVRRIISRKTMIPEVLDDEPLVISFPMSADSRGDRPLVLVPAEGNLQVWRFHEGWSRVQSIEQALETRLWPSVNNPGYNRSSRLSLSLGDVNGDQREDLILRRDQLTGTQNYAFHLQTADGQFTAEPFMTYGDKSDGRSWLGWVDINRDGRLDLIRNTWQDEPWFLPGTRSGKVLVCLYLADDHGRIAAEPRQIFRKNDWMPSLPMVDVDGDGFMDMILGHSLFDSRDGARKMITAKQLDFSLKFHFYRPGGGFPQEPDCQRNLIIHLDQHSLYLTWSRREYFERFVHLSGDFDGDGKKDLLVRDRGDQLSVYGFVSRSKGFNQKADFRFHCAEPIAELEVLDLNNDGVSDLVVKLKNRKALQLFISKKS